MKEDQPINNIKWRKASELTGNNYNPNKVAPPELKLLKISILEDGWTQPIVITPQDEIIDGFHRWHLTSKDKQIQKLTDGYVPTVTINPERSHQMMATIRHNRARGAHGVVKMAEIIAELINSTDLTVEEIQKRLGMEYEEVDRLYDNSGMIERGSLDKFGPAWKPQRTMKDHEKRERLQREARKKAL